MIRRLLLLAVAAGALACSPAVASAHSGVVSRTPAPGSANTTVKQVTLVFSQKLVTGKLDVYRGSTKLTPAGGGPRGARVTATFRRKLGRGAYTVRWRAVAGDGHAQTGSWSFRVR
jgi:methionine-rich copper-binding protein CopC